MASTFKKLISEWARLRIAEPREDDIGKKQVIKQKLDNKWTELRDFPSDEMSEEDINLLQHLDKWTVARNTTQRIGGEEFALPDPTEK